MNEQPYNYKVTIAYDGTSYCGWQIQSNGIAIQELIQDTIERIINAKVKLIGSGRTDAGVHATGQVAHFNSPRPLDLSRLQSSLNALLPPDIRILESLEVPLSFHAQYSPIGKIYHYHLHLEQVHDPFKRRYSLHVREKIDQDKLNNAAQLLLGTHDFTSFANESHSGSASHDPIRTLKRLDIVNEPGGIRLEFEGNGFLYKMVRNITGTLLEIAAGKRRLEELPIILAAKDRRKAGQTAPPQGLFLIKVNYP